MVHHNILGSKSKNPDVVYTNQPKSWLSFPVSNTNNTPKDFVHFNIKCMFVFSITPVVFVKISSSSINGEWVNLWLGKLAKQPAATWIIYRYQ